MRLILSLTAFTFATVSAFAAPPEGAKLSEIIAKIEQKADFKYIDEIDWDAKGHYEIEYYLNDGSKVEVNIDPKTGDVAK